MFIESVSLGTHFLTSSGDDERQEFQCAPVANRATEDRRLSNNFLEVGCNHLE
jgi:hypothetical protein